MSIEGRAHPYLFPAPAVQHHRNTTGASEACASNAKRHVVPMFWTMDMPL